MAMHGLDQEPTTTPKQEAKHNIIYHSTNNDSKIYYLFRIDFASLPNVLISGDIKTTYFILPSFWIPSMVQSFLDQGM
jgi:hypothetical protein